MSHRVVIIGGGFGGLNAARALRRAPVEVTVIDRCNYHLFQPLLYQVATGGLSPANIAAPLRKIFRKQRNARIVLGAVSDIDLEGRRVILDGGIDGSDIGFDTLIVAAGARNFYFGHDDWEQFAPGLKTIEDATEIRSRMLLAFEEAERESDPRRIEELLTFVVIGGGPTGVELAGALGEITRDTLRHEYRHIDTATARILLVEGSERVLGGFTPGLSERARQSLEGLGVTVRSGMRVSEILEDGVRLQRVGGAEDGDGDVIRTRNVLWAAGVRGSVLGEILAGKSGCQLDGGGRVLVRADLSIPGHDDVFVIGDLACYAHPEGAEPLPGIAPVAMQQGGFVARLVRARLAGVAPPRFRYRDRGIMATIGRAAAVAEVMGLRISGYFAWLAWLFVHLAFLIGFDNRILVLFQWAWSYFTFNRGARLITGREWRPGGAVGGEGSPAPPDCR